MAISTREVPVPNRCHADRERMRPSATGRYCGECEQHVHDLSSMTERQARRLMARAAEERLCVSYVADADGSLRTAPERPSAWVPLQRLVRKARPAALAASALWLAGCGQTFDMLPYEVQEAIPYKLQAAMKHPIDYAVCAMTPGCDPAPPPMVMGMMMAPTLPPATPGVEEPLGEPCDVPPTEQDALH